MSTQENTRTYQGPSPSSIIVDLLAEGLREACSMISLRTITSASETLSKSGHNEGNELFI